MVHPFAVGIYKDLMYWDDWHRKTVFVADKNNGKGIVTVLANMPSWQANISDPSFCSCPKSSDESRCTLVEESTKSTGAGPLGLAISDLDQDGLPDIATANRDANNASVLRHQ